MVEKSSAFVAWHHTHTHPHAFDFILQPFLFNVVSDVRIHVWVREGEGEREIVGVLTSIPHLVLKLLLLRASVKDTNIAGIIMGVC